MILVFESSRPGINSLLWSHGLQHWLQVRVRTTQHRPYPATFGNGAGGKEMFGVVLAVECPAVIQHSQHCPAVDHGVLPPTQKRTVCSTHPTSPAENSAAIFYRQYQNSEQVPHADAAASAAAAEISKSHSVLSSWFDRNHAASAQPCHDRSSVQRTHWASRGGVQQCRTTLGTFKGLGHAADGAGGRHYA